MGNQKTTKAKQEKGRVIRNEHQKNISCYREHKCCYNQFRKRCEAILNTQIKPTWQNCKQQRLGEINAHLPLYQDSIDINKT